MFMTILAGLGALITVLALVMLFVSVLVDEKNNMRFATEEENKLMRKEISAK